VVKLGGLRFCGSFTSSFIIDDGGTKLYTFTPFAEAGEVPSRLLPLTKHGFGVFKLYYSVSEKNLEAIVRSSLGL